MARDVTPIDRGPRRSAVVELRLVFRFALAVVLASSAWGISGCASLGHQAWRKGIAAELTESVTTEHFEVRWRTGSRAAPLAKWIAHQAEREVARICTQLEVANDTRMTLFLFDDGEDLAKTTKVQGTAGFAAQDSAFLIFGDGPARVHEMVHLVAYAKVGQGKTMFFAEGLANALLDNVKGFEIHAIAKYYRDNQRLPGMAEMEGRIDFYQWMKRHPGLNTYDIAGSWIRFLLDTEGVAKTKRYYVGEDAQSVFGKSIEQLEKDWHAALDRYEPSELIAMQVALTDGGPSERIARVEGESLSAGIEFTLHDTPTATPEGGLVLKYSMRFLHGEVKEGVGAFQSFVKYGWAKDGTQIDGARFAVKIDELTPADSGVYLGIVGVQHGPGEPRPVMARTILLTVIPKSELAALK